MKTPELLRVIEEGLKDVRNQIIKSVDPTAAARKTQPPETRLSDLEFTLHTLRSEVALLKSTTSIVEMKLAQMKSDSAAAMDRLRNELLTSAASTTTSPETRPVTARSRSRGSRAGS